MSASTFFLPSSNHQIHIVVDHLGHFLNYFITEGAGGGVTAAAAGRAVAGPPPEGWVACCGVMAVPSCAASLRFGFRRDAAWRGVLGRRLGFGAFIGSNLQCSVRNR